LLCASYHSLDQRRGSSSSSLPQTWNELHPIVVANIKTANGANRRAEINILFVPLSPAVSAWAVYALSRLLSIARQAAQFDEPPIKEAAAPCLCIGRRLRGDDEKSDVSQDAERSDKRGYDEPD
jgi:hypothetical protein